MNVTTLEKMKAMKFYGMRRAFESSLETRQSSTFTPDEFMNYLLQAEWDYRQNKKISMSLSNAKFRYQASMEEIDFSNVRNLDKNNLLRLMDCSFIENKENVLITGATGVGKSYVASALGHHACVKGFKVMYFNTSKLFSKLRACKADASFTKEINKIAKQDLLILDDFGLSPIDAQNRLMLMEMIEDRHGSKSTIIASQLPVAQWYELLEDQTLADAILDRIIHSSHRIELKGESMRKKQIKNN